MVYTACPIATGWFANRGLAGRGSSTGNEEERGKGEGEEELVRDERQEGEEKGKRGDRTAETGEMRGKERGC